MLGLRRAAYGRSPAPRRERPERAFAPTPRTAGLRSSLDIIRTSWQQPTGVNRPTRHCPAVGITTCQPFHQLEMAVMLIPSGWP